MLFWGDRNGGSQNRNGASAKQNLRRPQRRRKSPEAVPRQRARIGKFEPQPEDALTIVTERLLTGPTSHRLRTRQGLWERKPLAIALAAVGARLHSRGTLRADHGIGRRSVNRAAHDSHSAMA
jgi:hypothetical protein